MSNTNEQATHVVSVSPVVQGNYTLNGHVEYFYAPTALEVSRKLADYLTVAGRFGLRLQAAQVYLSNADGVTDYAAVAVFDKAAAGV